MIEICVQLHWAFSYVHADGNPAKAYKLHIG